MAYKVVVGLGKTGLSCISFLMSRGEQVVVMDTRDNPPCLEELKTIAPNIEIHLGELDSALLSGADEIILSPGLSIHHPVLAEQIAAGKSVVGDIELFARVARAPIIAVTGSNGKSTVVSMLQAMATRAGVYSELGGNVGIPVLDLLQKPAPQFYILELSSFQLLSTPSLHAHIAVILNFSENHLDYHKNMDEYYQAKLNIYRHCDLAVCNLDDASLRPLDTAIPKIYFSAQTPIENEYGLSMFHGKKYLAHGAHLLLAVDELQEMGEHFYVNALAALAIGEQMKLPMEAMLQTLKKFEGLPHRCRLVLKMDRVSWYNDSKATTVAATLAAVNSLRQEIPGRLIVILGGIGKGADFKPLAEGIAGKAHHAVLIGESAPELERVLQGHVSTIRVSTLEEALIQAKSLVGEEGFVLFSPACASYDMFNNFEHRGTVFTELVKGLYA